MNNLRPDGLDGFIGQAKCRQVLRVVLTAAKKRNETAPHMLLHGPPGLGKTTLARIVANEMGGRLVETIGAAIKTPHEMANHLLELKPNDVLFLDEIHAVPRRIEEALYGAMEDRTVSVEETGYGDLMKQLGISGSSKSKTTKQIPPFTLIGATTLLGLVSSPLRSRFTQILQLEPYSLEDLDNVVQIASGKLGFDVTPHVARQVSLRSRGTARTAINNLLWLRDYVMSDGGKVTDTAIEQAFALKGIDRSGLTHQDRAYLERLLDADEPVGVETLASSLGESVETLEAGIEPFLLQQGLIAKKARGRMATEKAKTKMETDRARVGTDA